MSEWQPIETAPKDGTPILTAYYDDGKNYRVAPSWWNKHLPCWYGYGRIQPSYWMPLPAPPKEPKP